MFTHKDVGRLDIPVNDVVLVQVLEPLADLDEVLPNHLLSDPDLSTVRLQGALPFITSPHASL